MKKSLILIISLLLVALIFPGTLLKAQLDLKRFRDTSSGKYGYKKGKDVIAIPAKYEDAATYFDEGMAAVMLNGKWGFIDTTGKPITPFKYDMPDDEEFGYFFSDGMAAVFLDSLFGFIDKTGKEVVPIKYWWLDPFEKGVGGVVLNKKWGFVNKSGKEITPIKFDRIKAGGFFQINYKWGLIDSTGKELIPPTFDEVEFFYENMAKVRLKDKWGYVNDKGQEVVRLQYEKIMGFQEGLAAVKFENKWGFIDRNGKVIIPYQYDVVFTGFHRGKATVSQNGKTISLDNPLTTNNPVPDPGAKANNVSVTLVTPPLPLKGNADPSMVGLWKYTDASGRLTFMKMNPDGTTESYLHSVTPANKSKGFCYWRIDGSSYESICDGGTSVNRFTIQKGYDAATGKPTLTLSGYTYIAADNKTSW